MSRASRAARRNEMHYLLTGERRWERFEATVIVGRDYADLADGEAALVAECQEAGRSVEVVANLADATARVYRIGGMICGDPYGGRI